MPISAKWYCRSAAAACLSACASVATGKASLARGGGTAVLTREQLSRMYTSSAFDVLGTLGLRARAGVPPHDRYVVCLDGTMLSGDLDVLRAIRATDLADVRVATGPDAAGGPDGRPQIRLTTLGTPRRQC